MKKLLSLLSAVSLTATGTSGVIACNKQDKKQINKEKQNNEQNNDLKT